MRNVVGRKQTCARTINRGLDEVLGLLVGLLLRGGRREGAVPSELPRRPLLHRELHRVLVGEGDDRLALLLNLVLRHRAAARVDADLALHVLDHVVVLLAQRHLLLVARLQRGVVGLQRLEVVRELRLVRLHDRQLLRLLAKRCELLRRPGPGSVVAA